MTSSLACWSWKEEIGNGKRCCLSLSNQFFKLVFLVVDWDAYSNLILNLVPLLERTILAKFRGTSLVVIIFGGFCRWTFRIVVSIGIRVARVLLFRGILIFFFPVLVFFTFKSTFSGGICQKHAFENVDHGKIKGTSLVFKNEFKDL